jgi:hypothetical protein
MHGCVLRQRDQHFGETDGVAPLTVDDVHPAKCPAMSCARTAVPDAVASSARQSNDVG